MGRYTGENIEKDDKRCGKPWVFPWKTLGTWSTLGYPIGDITRKNNDGGFHWDISFPFSCFLWTFTGNNHSIYSTGSAIGEWAEHVYTDEWQETLEWNSNLALVLVRFYMFYLSEVAWCQPENEFIISRSWDGNRRVPGWFALRTAVHDCSIRPTDATNC